MAYSYVPCVTKLHVLLLVHCQVIVAYQRFKRQILPTDHVMVYSLNSSVSIADWVTVTSDESKVEFQEKYLRGKVWSTKSKLSFQPYGQAENFTAQHNVFSVFELPQTVLQTKCEQIHMFLRANRSADGHSYVQYKADQDVALVLSDDLIQIYVVSGRWAQVIAVTRQIPAARRISMGSNVSDGLSRQLHIVSTNDNCDVDIILYDAQMKIQYGNITVQMSSDYRFLRLSSALYKVILKTVLSPFEMTISDQEMVVHCVTERAVVQMLPNSSNIIIKAEQYSKVVIQRESGSVVIGEQEVRPTGSIILSSMQLNILLKAGDISSIHASANRSQITVQTLSTNMTLIASHHAVDITGGTTNLHVRTGNVSVDVIANEHPEPMSTMLTPFRTSWDNFHGFEPVSDMPSYNFSVFVQNYSIVNLMPPMQITGEMIINDSDFRKGITLGDGRRTSVSSSKYMQATLNQPSSWITVINHSKTAFSSISSTDIAASLTTSTTQFQFFNYTEHIYPYFPQNMNGTFANAILSEASSSTGQSIKTTLGSAFTSRITVDTATGLPLSNSSVMSIANTLFPPTTLSWSMQYLSTSLTSGAIFPTSTAAGIPVVLVTKLTSAQEILNTAITAAPVISRDTQRQDVSHRISTTISANVDEIRMTEERGLEETTWKTEGIWDNEQTEFDEFNSNLTKQIGILTTTLPVTASAVSQPTQKVRSTTCITITSLSASELTKTTFSTDDSTVLMKPMVVKPKHSIGSAWTPFASPPFVFPPRKLMSTTPFIEAPEKNARRNTVNSRTSENGSELSTNFPSISMADALKSMFGTIVQQGYSKRENLYGRIKPRTDFSQLQKLSPNKFKRALNGFRDGEIFELQLKILPGVDITTKNFLRELMLVVKKFVFSTHLHEQQPTIDEDAAQIKLESVERSGKYLKVQYSLFSNTEVIRHTTNCNVNETSEKYECIRNRGLSAIDFLFVITGIVIAVLLTLASVFVRYRKRGKAATKAFLSYPF